MPLALLTGNATGSRARFDRRAQKAEIGLRLPRDEASGGNADVAAVEAETCALGKLPKVWFGEVCIGATRARCRTVEAFGDAAQQRLALEARRLRVGLDDIAEQHCCSLLSV
jgi:hypothetical protein